MQKQIYLDNNSTTAISPEVVLAMRDLERTGLANPASQHRAGRQAMHYLEEAKESILRAIGAPVTGMSAAQIVLTSGGSEANNLALNAYTHQAPGLVIVGSMEHPSLRVAAELSTLCLNPVRILPAKLDGSYDLEVLARWIDEINSGHGECDRISLVSLMLANNETGVTNDISGIAKLCRPHSIPVHCDIVQAVGKIEIDMVDLGLDAATLNAHKVHGPVGIGALVLNNSMPPRPTVIGGGQQLGWRAGTEPVALAVGFASALQQAAIARESGHYTQLARLRNRFEESIRQQLDFVHINGDQNRRLPQTSNLSFLGIGRQALQMALDLEGVACSAGAACSSGSSRPSAVLLAMGLDSPRVESALRFSFSRYSSAEEIEQAAEIVVRVARRLYKPLH